MVQCSRFVKKVEKIFKEPVQSGWVGHFTFNAEKLGHRRTWYAITGSPCPCTPVSRLTIPFENRILQFKTMVTTHRLTNEKSQNLYII